MKFMVRVLPEVISKSIIMMRWMSQKSQFKVSGKKTDKLLESWKQFVNFVKVLMKEFVLQINFTPIIMIYNLFLTFIDIVIIIDFTKIVFNNTDSNFSIIGWLLQKYSLYLTITINMTLNTSLLLLWYFKVNVMFWIYLNTTIIS